MESLGVGLDKRIRRIAEFLDVGVLLLGSDAELEFASGRAEAMLSLDADDREGWRGLLEALGESVHRCWSERANGALVELPWQHGSQSRQITCEIYLLDENECEGYLVVLRDLSLQRAMEADLALAAQQRNLSRLYLGLAHDLRSPLNSIVLNLELLKRSLADAGADLDFDTNRSRWLAVVEEELRRLTASLDSLLSQTVVPSDERRRFDVTELVRDLAGLLRGQARQQGVELEVNAPASGVVVEGRHDQILRAALNLAVNGLESAGESGRVALSVERRGDDAVLTISDTGPGVGPEVREQLFQLHFTTKETGTGLGLYVARAVFEADGGSVDLVDSPGWGATFEARLPLARESAPECR